MIKVTTGNGPHTDVVEVDSDTYSIDPDTLALSLWAADGEPVAIFAHGTWTSAIREQSAQEIAAGYVKIIPTTGDEQPCIGAAYVKVTTDTETTAEDIANLVVDRLDKQCRRRN